MIFEKQNGFIGSVVPCITDRHWRVIKYRWEFMRRNEEYRKDYEIMTLAHGDERLIGRLAFDMAKKWDVGYGVLYMVNPSLSFEDLYKEAVALYHGGKENERMARVRVVQRLGYGTNPWPPSGFSNDAIGGGSDEILVDISLPDALLKEQVMQQVDLPPVFVPVFKSVPPAKPVA